MVNTYYTPEYNKLNYEEAQKRIKEVIESGEKYVYLPSKKLRVEMVSFTTKEKKISYENN